MVEKERTKEKGSRKANHLERRVVKLARVMETMETVFKKNHGQIVQILRNYGNSSQKKSWSNRSNSSQQSGWYGKSDSSSKGAKSGKGSKGKDSGKNQDNTCHRCGKVGHFARDCRVRLVGDDSNQTETKTDKTTSHVNHVNNNSGNVNRVSFEPCNSIQQLDFDISDMNAVGSCNFSVNMVKMDVCGEI